MYPEIFSIGSITVHSYGLMIALGILVIAAALYREAPRESIDPDHILEAIIIAAFSGLIGARILYMLINWSYYSTQPASAFFTRFEGLSFFGGLFCATILVYLWSRWRGIGFLKLADLLAPYLALGYAFGRVGCFLNGCCYGLVTDLPWALPAGLADDLPRHPVQLYAAFGAILMFIVLKKLRHLRPFVGFVTVSLFGLYGLLRFTTEFFRQEEAAWLGLTAAQLFSLGLILASLIFIAVVFSILPEKSNLRSRARDTDPDPEDEDSGAESEKTRRSKKRAGKKRVKK